jgi:hypothetical protein
MITAKQRNQTKKKYLSDYSGELLVVQTFLGIVEIASNWRRFV